VLPSVSPVKFAGLKDHRQVSDDLLLRINSPEFRAMSERVLRVTELTSRLNVSPFDDESRRAELLELIRAW